jgi:hypothetical protein
MRHYEEYLHQTAAYKIRIRLAALDGILNKCQYIHLNL